MRKLMELVAMIALLRMEELVSVDDILALLRMEELVSKRRVSSDQLIPQEEE